MEMPKPGDVHRRLSNLIGEWMGVETLHPSPWEPAGGSATGVVRNRWIADGFAVVQEYEQRRGDTVTFRGHGVFWYDPAKQEYVMHWWDSVGGTAGEFRGQFSGDVLTLGSPMPQGGHSRTSWTLSDPDAHAFLMEVSPDGENWSPAMEGRYRKAAPKAVAKTVKTAAAKKPAKKVARAAAKPAPRKATKKVAKKAVKRTAKKVARKGRR